ncbi:MAG: type II toxin-antitoxin system HicB family antitoxin [Drouetiella hepatica Uher 2000/2452]|jgi:predicted RNase H-like HicB family nuclease|uniref:Type II toxin-antitoxin system HicB family antitoxin n=1 Tax=Drouetiella hepatica Uher 2000/2452 TaxID=904376 RepID=A0A951QCT3_9CYAN|nr:type II toxin-antitoxin system HicB family antitoxin [Drouetiella hepatica Uher 2000/2452]
MSQKLQYRVVIERGAKSYGAYLPDLPGCIATGKTKEETLGLIREAIELHLEALHQQGLLILEPYSSDKLVGD